MLVAMSFVTFGQRWTALSSNTPAQPQVKLISSSEEQIVVNFTLGGFSTTRVETPNGIQNVISVPKMAASLIAGTPDLPQFPIPAIIGDRAEMSVAVTDAQFTEFSIEVAPSKGNISRSINPDEVPYTYGEMYSQNAFYPAEQAYLEAPYIIRDFRGQNIMVKPFAYNPVTKTLRVYTDMTITMTKVSDNGENQKIARKSNNIKVSPEIKNAYNRRFINFGKQTAKYTFTEDEGDMLVICPEQYMEAMQPFVDWKNMSGRPTTMVSVAQAGGNNANNIKTYIQDLYENKNLEFILLVGDYADITPHSMNGGCSDNWLAMLEGNDYYLEAFVGRFSVESVKDVETHVNKVLYYERDMPSSVTWADHGLGIGAIGAGYGHFGEDDYQHIDLIRDTLLHYTYTNVTDLHQGAGASANSISAAVNDGVSIINYCNHGSETSWGVANYSNSHVNALTNDYMWPMVISVACLNGKFNYSQPCFGETWLRATNNQDESIPTGAVGGMFSWISQPWIPPQYGQDEMIDILTEWHSADLFNHTMGGCFLNGDEYILDASPEDQGDTHNTWILFGDPSLMVRTANPTEMNVSLNPNTLLIGMSELNLTVDADYAIATLSMDGQVISSTKIVNGEGTLSFEPLTNVGNATLVILGYNRVTSITEVEIVPAEGPYVVLNGYGISSENDQLDYGEDATLNISLKNVGVEGIGNVSVVLSTESEYINEIYNSNTVIANIAPNEVVELNDLFGIEIANNVPDGERVNFNLEFVSGEHLWTGNFNVTINAPVFELSQIRIDGQVQAGGTATMIYDFINNGHSDAQSGTFSVFSSSNDVTFETTSINFDAIPVGETVTFEVPFTVAEGVEEGSSYEVDYLLAAGHYTYSDMTTISIGSIMDGFETGDFTTFNWTNGSGSSWTIVSTDAYEGSYCAKSGRIGSSQETSLILDVQVYTDGEISFFKKVSSETNYDKLFFYIDDVEKGNWSGEVSWSEERYPITTGNHNFKWTYRKDYSVDGGSDCAWIDNVQMPATNVIVALNAVTDLAAEVNENDVTLTWAGVEEATEYIISRNGEEISVQAETEFTDTVEDGVYTYSVIARNESLASQPAHITVNVGTVNVTENEIEFSIYPNPATNTLYINGGNAEYSFVMYNGMGQQVANGTVEGTYQINVSDMTKGIYFIRITTGSQISIQKVVVE